MPSKEELIKKLCTKPLPKGYTIRELKQLMSKCNCEFFQGGRGSGIGFVHKGTKRVLQFDAPHPQKELYTYQIKKCIQYLKDIGEIEEET